MYVRRLLVDQKIKLRGIIICGIPAKNFWPIFRKITSILFFDQYRTVPYRTCTRQFECSTSIMECRMSVVVSFPTHVAHLSSRGQCAYFFAQRNRPCALILNCRNYTSILVSTLTITYTQGVYFEELSTVPVLYFLLESSIEFTWQHVGFSNLRSIVSTYVLTHVFVLCLGASNRKDGYTKVGCKFYLKEVAAVPAMGDRCEASKFQQIKFLCRKKKRKLG